MKHRCTQSAGFDDVEQMMHSGQKIKLISVFISPQLEATESGPNN